MVLDEDTEKAPDEEFEAEHQLRDISNLSFCTGFNGRENRFLDTCYNQWIGGTLHLLEASNLIDERLARQSS